MGFLTGLNNIGVVGGVGGGGGVGGVSDDDMAMESCSNFPNLPPLPEKSEPHPSTSSSDPQNMVGLTFLRRFRPRNSMGMSLKSPSPSPSPCPSPSSSSDSMETLVNSSTSSPSPSSTSSSSSSDSLLMGERYLFGRDGEIQDEVKAIKYLKRSAFKYGGNPEAQATLGFCYEFGLGLEQDYKAAENLYICAAVKGSGLAQIRLAFFRRYGRPGIKIDRVEAEEWVLKVSKDTSTKAIHWIRQAADQDRHAASQYVMGVCYHDG